MAAQHAEDSPPASPCLRSPLAAVAADPVSPPCAGAVEAVPPTEHAGQHLEAHAAAVTSASVLSAAAVEARDNGSSAAQAVAAALPTLGWPVQWQQPAALGMPMLPPGPQQWMLPAGVACAWQPAADLVPGPAQLLQLQQHTEPCWGQPAAGDSPCRAEREHSVEWEPPFSVASDEELPGSPASSGGNSAACSPAAEDGESGQGTKWCGAGPPGSSGAQQAQLLLEGQGGEDVRQQGEQQARREQEMLDELAALSIRQYQQARELPGGGTWLFRVIRKQARVFDSPPLSLLWLLPLQHARPEERECEQLLAADGAWDVAMLAMGGRAGGPDQKAAANAAPPPACAAAAQPGSPAGAAACLAPALRSAAAALPSSSAAPPPPQRPAVPYQPLKAAAAATAAARQQGEAAGWRRLRQRADELVLWHEYAAELGIGGEEPGCQAQAPQIPLPGVAVPQAPPAAECLAAGGGASANVGTAACGGQLAMLHQRLWRPAAETAPAASPAVLASPLLPCVCGPGSSCSEASGTPASSSCLPSEESSSVLSSAATSSSLGVGAR